MRPGSEPPHAAASGRGPGVGALAFHPDCPTRPPDWRWQRARQLFEEAARPRTWDDAAVRRARDYQAALRRCRRRGDEGRLAERMPDIQEALVIHAGEPNRRWEVRARLLAREPAADIARRSATDPAGVAAYERLFFNVAERLGNGGYIINCAIGLHPTPTRPDDGRILCLLGYFGGPHVVDALIVGATGLSRPQNPGELCTFMTRLTCEQLLLTTCVGLLTVPVAGREGEAFLRAYDRFVASERRHRRGVPTADDLLPRVELMSEHFPDFRPVPGDGRG